MVMLTGTTTKYLLQETEK